MPLRDYAWRLGVEDVNHDANLKVLQGSREMISPFELFGEYAPDGWGHVAPAYGSNKSIWTSHSCTHDCWWTEFHCLKVVRGDHGSRMPPLKALGCPHLMLSRARCNTIPSVHVPSEVAGSLNHALRCDKAVRNLFSACEGQALLPFVDLAGSLRTGKPSPR